MRLYCKACNNELTGTLISAAPEQAYSKELTDPEFGIHKYRMLPGLTYFNMAPECWVYDEEKGESVPRGEVRGINVLAEASLTGAKVVNQSKGCCKFDSFDVVCGSCGAELGWGGNDCWQDDKVNIEDAVVYKDETK